MFFPLTAMTQGYTISDNKIYQSLSLKRHLKEQPHGSAPSMAFSGHNMTGVNS